MENFLSQEMEEMKQQITILKRKLENQNITNERLFQEALKEKISNINRIALIQSICLVIATPFCFFNFERLGISLAFNLFTTIFLIIALIYTWWSHNGLKSKINFTDDLIKVTEKLLRTRKRYKQWHYFSYPWLLIWLVWLGGEFYRIAIDKSMLVGLIVGSLVGGIIGGTFGWLQQRKIYRNIDVALEQIKNIQEIDKQ